MSIGKSEKKDPKKTTTRKASEPGERIYVDISYTFEPSMGGSKYWLLVIDQFTKFKWSRFIKKKSDLAINLVEIIKLIRFDNYQVKYIRCDNAGENQVIKKTMIDNEMFGMKLEYTTPYTPQFNGLVERSFAFLYDRVRAMLNNAIFNLKMRTIMWAECANTAVFLDNVHTRFNNMSSYEKYYGKVPSLNGLRAFGEVGIVKIHSPLRKLMNRGKYVMLLGYDDEHSSDTYRFYDIFDKTTTSSRDVKWINLFLEK